MIRASVANVTNSRPEAPYYVKALALGLSAYLIGIHLWTWILTLSLFLGGRSDFRQLYTAGYMVRSGNAHELYEYDAQLHFQNRLVSPGDIALPFNHLAYEALLFVPFSLLSYRAAYFALLGFNLTGLAITFKLLRPGMKNLAAIYRWLPPAMFLAFLPIAAALLQGQDSILLLTLLAAALVSLHSGRELAAGVLVGLGLFKFQIVIPIALLYLIWRRWRFVFGFASLALAETVASIWLVGTSQFITYARSLITLGGGVHEVTKPVANLMANLHGLVFGLTGGNLPGFWIVAVTAILSGIVLLLAAFSHRMDARSGDAFLIAVTACALVSYYLLIHDLSIMLIPVAVSLDRNIAAEATGHHPGRLMARAAALMFVAPVWRIFHSFPFYIVALPLCIFFFALLRSGQYRN